MAATLVGAASAQTGTWTAPVVLSGGGQGWEAAAAVDGNGIALALWDERTSRDQLWSRAKPSAGTWGRASLVSPGALQTTMVFPAVRMSATGFATAVWTDADGVWTADRRPDSKWNAPQLLAAGASGPIFAMNSKGDAAVAWTVGGATAQHSTVMAVLRPAGGGWTSAQTVASGVHITADHAGVGETGDAMVTWESYHAFCTPEECTLSHFILHAARQEAGTGVWVDSGALLGPDAASHDARVAFNGAGRAIQVALSNLGTYISATQGPSGGAWSAFSTVANPGPIAIVSDLASDQAGNATLVYEAIGFSTSQALAVSGTIGSNTWSAPVVLSGNDSVSQIYFALAPSGTAVAAWLSFATPEIHAVVRATGTGMWSTPVTVSRPGSTEIGPEAAAVNSAGVAIVIYSGYNPNDVHTEYATMYTP